MDYEMFFQKKFFSIIILFLIIQRYNSYRPHLSKRYGHNHILLNLNNQNTEPSLPIRNLSNDIKKVLMVGLSSCAVYLTKPKPGYSITIEEESKLYNTRISLSDDDIYTDLDNSFSVLLPAGWKKYPKPPLRLRVNELLLKDIKFAETIFVAKNFAESTYMSITKSDATRLLKDFNIEWWFSALNQMIDLGSPKLIAQLLVQQRELELRDIGDYELKQSFSTISDAIIKDNILYFTVLTPIINKYGELVGDSINTQANVKSVLKDNSIVSIWLQGLPSVFSSDYLDELNNIEDSFKLI